MGHELMQRGGWRISGTTRDPDKRKALRARGVNAHLFDYDAPLPDPLYILRDVTHLLICTPPSGEGDPSFNLHAQDILDLPNLEWVGYLSTTSPYGDRGGKWVDEKSEARPITKRGSRRLNVERQWLSLFEAYQLPVHIFRLAGIYGPGRSALDSVRSGIARRIDKPGHAFSRIHVEDLVQILLASMQTPSAGELYNVCDDMPAPSHEVIEYACRLLGIEPPPLLSFHEVDLAPIAISFYADNKRVRNDKMKDLLDITLKYANYKVGLEACLEAENYASSLSKRSI
ncbi:MAG: NAD(P)-dependent oxidoreductase [Zetaproteobacteria bacterium]|nr:MAG: NAD(P)-dependent oxidoreductase [Zetaproteobacteria bacterium]